ncbi:MAG: hypothetical protein KatS3mg105_0802 [Gemmatales bacterium]|nr:MAG: hypothetical protein KatS3mg105_0802 [Gemmatales bacterium]
MTTVKKTHPRLVLKAATAEDLMTPNPLSIRQDAVIKEAVAFLTDKGITAAPVIDDAGRPVGVLSRADIVVHDREKVEYVPAAADRFQKPGFQIENVDHTKVADIMTPVVFSVAPDTSANRVVEEMIKLKVHRLFVVDDDGVLIGVISAMDILSRLELEE